MMPTEEYVKRNKMNNFVLLYQNPYDAYYYVYTGPRCELQFHTKQKAKEWLANNDYIFNKIREK